MTSSSSALRASTFQPRCALWGRDQDEWKVGFGLDDLGHVDGDAQRLQLAGLARGPGETAELVGRVAQASNQLGSDETRASGNEYPHDRRLLPGVNGLSGVPPWH
jgi:hypothetical protein